MKKRLNFGRLGAMALALTLITTCLMGGTLAKYTSKVEGSGKATVAKWKVAFKNGNDPLANNFEIDLADTGSNKNNVTDKKIAPGSTGSIPIEIDAAGSEVAATLSYTIDKKDIGTVPIEFYTDEACTTPVTWTGTTLEETKDITVDATGENAKLSKTLYWKWNTTSDADDTTEGNKETADTGKIQITLKAEQKIETTSTP